MNITCKVKTDLLGWKINNMVLLFPASGVNGPVMVGDTKFILLSESEQEVVSRATLSNINSNHNGTVMTCVNTLIRYPGPKPEEMASITIIVKGTDFSIFINLITRKHVCACVHAHDCICVCVSACVCLCVYLTTVIPV